MSNSPKHDSIFPFMERWGLTQWHMWFCFIEPPLPMFATGEEPDLVFFGDRRRCDTVDVKTSYADSDKHTKKPHVKAPKKAMGERRWILAHESLTRLVIPDRNGWLKYNDAGEIWIASKAEPFGFYERNVGAEWELLARQYRKVMFGQQHTPHRSSGRESGQQGLTGPQLEKVKRAFNACGYVPLTAAEIKRAASLDMTANRIANLLEHTDGIRMSRDMGKRVFELTATAKGAA